LFFLLKLSPRGQCLLQRQQQAVRQVGESFGGKNLRGKNLREKNLRGENLRGENFPVEQRIFVLLLYQ